LNMQEIKSWSSRNSKTVTAARSGKVIEIQEEKRVINSAAQAMSIKAALKDIPELEVIHNILFLGVMGQALDIVGSRFKDARLTVFEENDNAINAVSETAVSSRVRQARIVVQNILQSLSTTREKFDFIIVNLSREQLTEELFRQMDNVSHLHVHLLVNDGSKVNGFNEKSRHDNLAYYRRLGFKPIPDNYIHYRACKEFLDREAQARSRFGTVGYEGCYGQSLHYGPWYIENYFSDLEPEVKPHGPFRMVLWQRIQDQKKPKKWFSFWKRMTTRRTGFVNLGVYGQDYHKFWTTHAQKHRKKWLELEKNKQWELVEVGPDEFAKYYRKSDKDFFLKQIFIDLLYRELASQKKNVKILAARRAGSEILEAGLVTVDIPEAKTSIHLISFILDSAKTSPVTYGMIDYWFSDLIKRGFSFADFCIFWAPGDPKEWQGYSRFKAQFGVQYINYPAPLVRWPGRLKFLP
jgi:hypothetical protein